MTAPRPKPEPTAEIRADDAQCLECGDPMGAHGYHSGDGSGCPGREPIRTTRAAAGMTPWEAFLAKREQRRGARYAKRQSKLILRLTPEELDDIQWAAAREERSAGDWLRTLVKWRVAQMKSQSAHEGQPR